MPMVFQYPDAFGRTPTAKRIFDDIDIDIDIALA
jgi:hypothetical protein